MISGSVSSSDNILTDGLQSSYRKSLMKNTLFFLRLNLDCKIPKLSASQNYPTFIQLVVCGTKMFALVKNKQMLIHKKSFLKYVRLLKLPKKFCDEIFVDFGNKNTLYD